MRYTIDAGRPARSLAALACAALMSSGSALAQSGPPAPDPDVLAERAALAESGRFLEGFTAQIANATGPDLAAALDAPLALLTSSSVSGPAAANGVFAGLGVILPRQGNTFAVLSSGIAGTSAPEPGVDFSPGGVSGDAAQLTLEFNVPVGVNRLGFDFNFLSAEYPDFVGSVFNDTFSATITDAGGSRTVAFASVNSAFFFAASASRAGGSGFDIFTPNPSGVDTSFPGGLPDAGLTDWQRVDVPIQGGGPVTLRFRVLDLGDGILDSAVILDNLRLSSLEIIDPNDALLLNDGTVTTDTDALAQATQRRERAAADGVTQVVLRSAVPGAGSVEFSLDNANAPEDGGMAPLGGTGRASSVTAQSVSTPQGYMAFALYTVPDEFNRSGDQGLRERPVGLKAVYTPSAGGDPIETRRTLTLVRPPVVLIHGLWSSAGTWTLPLATDGRFDITVADYSGTNASYFSVNRLVPSNFTRAALAAARARGTAVTQVDVVAHSMGGLLSRKHVALPNYERKGNFHKGDFHKLLTFDTPHTGSPLANVLAGLRDAWLIGGLFSAAFDALGKPLDQGAIDDLSKGSGAIQSIPQTRVPSHALVGIGGSDALTLVPGWIGRAYAIINFFAGSVDIFQNLQHDAIVGRQSQEGGLSPSAYSVFGGIDGIHTFNTGSTPYSNRAVQLLNDRADGASFEFFPAPASLFAAAPEPVASPLHLPTLAAGGLAISAPAAGTLVTSGTTVQVLVEPLPGTSVERVLVVGTDTAAVDDSAPFLVELPVPVDLVGELTIRAFGLSASNELSDSGSVSLRAVPAATLQSVRIVNRDPILFGAGSTQRLAVVGTYSDGVVRDLTRPLAGTTYLVADARFVTASATGLITAREPGITTVVARNSGRQDSVSVTVLESLNQPPVADAGPDQSVECIAPGATSVSLSGLGSYDPDGDPLAYTWTGAFPEGGGTVDGATPLVSFGLGSHTVTLVVSDGVEDSEPDTTEITIADTTPPVMSAVTATPAQLWPPNHRMEPVTLSVSAADGCDTTAPACAISGVSSDEPAGGTPDWRVTGPLSLELRAERDGSGDGRVYTITVTCTDGSGNAATGAALVTVPHDRR